MMGCRHMQVSWNYTITETNKLPISKKNPINTHSPLLDRSDQIINLHNFANSNDEQKSNLQIMAAFGIVLTSEPQYAHFLLLASVAQLNNIVICPTNRFVITE